MSLPPSKCSPERLHEWAAELDISRLGVAEAHQVARSVMTSRKQWLDSNYHGEMAYLERHTHLRRHPDQLLEGARSVIVVAFNYFPAKFQPADAPQFAYYAYGRDYHEVVRERLTALANRIVETYGGTTRVCVDTAPLPERYWAVDAGLGFIGRNSQLIIPGLGSYFVLGEIITTVAFEPSAPCAAKSCGSCGRCKIACPGGAIMDNGTIDARRCLSYLTIEYRGDTLPSDINLGRRIYGCDTCQQVCPHNSCAAPTAIADFTPTPEFLALNRDSIQSMTAEQFSTLFRHSAVKRTKIKGLLRNLAHGDKQADK